MADGFSRTDNLLQLVRAKDLTPTELRVSKIPDECLFSLWVTFQSSSGYDYEVGHNGPNSGRGIILINTDEIMDTSDFLGVEEIVLRLIKEKFEHVHEPH